MEKNVEFMNSINSDPDKKLDIAVLSFHDIANMIIAVRPYGTLRLLSAIIDERKKAEKTDSNVSKELTKKMEELVNSFKPYIPT